MAKRRQVRKKKEDQQSSIKITKENIKKICPRNVRIVLERIDYIDTGIKAKKVSAKKQKPTKKRKVKKVVPFYNISVGDIIWAKLRGYSAWPATVISSFSNM